MKQHPLEKETLRRLDNLTRNLDRILETPQNIYLEDLEDLEEELNRGDEEEDD